MVCMVYGACALWVPCGWLGTMMASLTETPVTAALCVYTVRSMSCPSTRNGTEACCMGGPLSGNDHACCPTRLGRCAVDCTTFPRLEPACAYFPHIATDSACATNSGFYCTNPGGGDASTCCNIGMMCRSADGEHSVCCPGRDTTCGEDCATGFPKCLKVGGPMTQSTCPNNFTYWCAKDEVDPARNHTCCAVENSCVVASDSDERLCCGNPQGVSDAGGVPYCSVDCTAGEEPVCVAPNTPVSAQACPAGSHSCVEGGGGPACCEESHVCTSSNGQSVCCGLDGDGEPQTCGENCCTCVCRRDLGWCDGLTHPAVDSSDGGSSVHASACDRVEQYGLPYCTCPSTHTHTHTRVHAC